MATVEIQLPDEFGSVAEYAAEIRRVFERYQYLSNMHILNFFVTGFWQELPAEWREYLVSDRCDMDSLISMASTGKIDQSAPESLRSYVRTMFHLRLNYRSSRPVDHDEEERRRKELWYFLDGMNPKKQVEVAELSRLVHEVAAESNCSLAVDVGAGQGYLSRVLAYSSASLPVLAIDSSDTQQRGAELLQQRTIKRLRGPRAAAGGFKWDDRRAERLVHTVMHVSLDGAAQLAERAHATAPDARWLLCGLHACGDLSSAVLKAFAESDATAVVLVPCCYNHISEAPRERSAVGFPLSAAMHGARIGQNALKTACQATSRWDASPEATVDAFRRNHMRALLHQLMVAQNQIAPDGVAPAVGRVTNSELQTARMQLPACGTANASADEREFAAYALAALTKLNHAWRPTAEQCIACYRQHGSAGLQQIAAAWTLKALAGPLIECMLVVDRALYLAEHCGSAGRVRAFALFDPVTSPRNVVLVAQRR
ncbi:hypothetical protein LPJ63_000057 [Coemansia sp. RSA 2711]|nr:hypothetical protein LPJ63_000057 [Coemansia sp. RSA 2711]KAJ2310782.1 hypothetical protein IWW54_003001 [Coemansia sp. RSA 2705]